MKEPKEEPKEEAERIKCENCNGDGFAAEHDMSYGSHDECGV